MVNALNGGLKMLVTNAVFLGPQQAHCPVVASGVLIENPDDLDAQKIWGELLLQTDFLIAYFISWMDFYFLNISLFLCVLFPHNFNLASWIVKSFKYFYDVPELVLGTTPGEGWVGSVKARQHFEACLLSV